MNRPGFWDDPDAPLGRILAPLGWLYAETTAWRLAHGKLWRAPAPVICVGNLTAGGAGKTPVVLDLTARFAQKGARPAILSRGYGGRERGPLKVDPLRHTAADVGDEPLLLARTAPCWISADRARGAKAIVADGAGVIIMDDGLQNPDLAQDLRLIVIDGATGFGNRRAMPAGPLRERITAGIGRADLLIVIGEDAHGLVAEFSGRLPILRADLRLQDAGRLAGARLVAFAGIGRPEKFHASLAEAGADILEFHPFADHHPYSETELSRLADRAERLGAELATTEKDWVRLTPDWQARATPLPVAIAWRNEAALTAALAGLAARG